MSFVYIYQLKEKRFVIEKQKHTVFCSSGLGLMASTHSRHGTMTRNS
jgi:hypothetical protein